MVIIDLAKSISFWLAKCINGVCAGVVVAGKIFCL
jgi:hypothetical protein